MQLAEVTLEDKYTRQSGRIYVTGSQALVRLAMLQRQRDAAAGLSTAGFISGYRGSPLGGYDLALWKAAQHLRDNDIQFQPGVNEDLAATSVWGTQQTGLGGRSKHDGVFGIWYGKGPGVDRSGDPMKHGNMAGSAPHGGVLLLFGDDPLAKSSTLAHQSEQALMASMIPVLNPASIQEYLDYGLAAFALSRYSGCWVGMKCVTDTVEGSASVSIDPERLQLLVPEDFELPPEGVHIRFPDTPLEQERRLVRYKLPAAQAFVRANGLDRVTHDVPVAQRRLGIVTTGKAWSEVVHAFDRVGLDERARRALGISVYKVAMPWPLEPEGIRAFSRGQQELLLVEEKRSIIEEQLARTLWDMEPRPRLVGKTDEDGRTLVPADGELTVDVVAAVLARRALRLGAEGELAQRLQRALEWTEAGDGQAPVERTPWFCAGCPHNTSTNVPEGSRAFAGIGCHTMAMRMPNRRTEGFTHMGGEGAQWIGQAPFSKDQHVFQNLGDGTYYHSGLLAIRAAVAAGVNITYKILFNDAVAMTGGQPVEGQLTPWEISRQVQAEGVQRIEVVTDDPDKYPAETPWATGVQVRHRRELDALQRELRETPGVSALIYDQTCAAEKRRRRKRGKYPDPAKRTFINESVCEGCGDCGVVSNCVAVKPLETEFGRKRQIDQASCNKDYSCAEGFCPSFVMVYGGELRKADRTAGGEARVPALPEPAVAEADAHYNVLVTGIGGTGVVTVGALLGMAGHLEGKGVSVLDQTGLSQKNGAVTSHVRFAADPETLQGKRIGLAETDLVLGCDMVVAAGHEAMTTYGEGRTRAVINSHVVPIAAFAVDPDMAVSGTQIENTISRRIGEEASHFVNATRIAGALAGDPIYTNPFLLGYACQKGLLPVSREAIERAIELNGVDVEANKKAFHWGRYAAHDPDAVEALAARGGAPEQADIAVELDEIVARREAHLIAYQDRAYARRYRALVDRVRETEEQRIPGSRELTRAVAYYYAKLLAYKDEYEVARLYSRPEFRQRLQAQFQGDYKLRVRLAPPLFAKRDPATGHLQKKEYGPWMFKAFGVLARLRFLRGTALDPFGRTAERRMERQLIRDYEALVDELLGRLDADNRDLAVELASLPEHIRGFGHVKQRHVEQVRQREEALRARLRGQAPQLKAVAQA